MVRKAKSAAGREKGRLGNLSPRYKFFLNPYRDVRFTTSCPGCLGKIRQRKLPLAIHIDDWGMVVLNKTCRFCPSCDVLIAHRDEIVSLLSQHSPEVAAHVSADRFLVVGTLERGDWRRGITTPLTNAEMLDALHDFEDYVRFQPQPRWTLPDRPRGSYKPR